MKRAFSMLILSIAAVGAADTEKQAPVKMPPFRVQAAPEEFYVSRPIHDDRVAFLKSREQSPPRSPMTLFRIPGGRDGDRIVRVNGKVVAEISRRERETLMFTGSPTLKLEVQAPGTTSSRDVIATRLVVAPVK